MERRAILARMRAKIGLAPPVPVTHKADKKSLGKIAMLDLQTGSVVKEFDNIEQAVAEGFNLPNIVGAIKGNKKYKGHFWTAENEVS
jgi:hypothetical protein